MFSGSTLAPALAIDRSAPAPQPVRRLSYEEEAELIRRVQLERDSRAADAIARAHRPFVVQFALKYRRYGVPLDDLIAEAHVGLVHALGKFDPQRGVRFVTYAKHWMRAFVVKHVLANLSIVSGGSMVMRPRWFFLLRRERARLACALGESREADGQLAERLGLSRDRVRRMLDRLDMSDLSLDAELVPNSGIRMLDQLPAVDNQELGFFELESRANLKGAVTRALATLDGRERYIVERRMMVETSEALSLADLGQLFGISRERVRQLEARAARKLRRAVLASGGPSDHEWLPALRSRAGGQLEAPQRERVRSKLARARAAARGSNNAQDLPDETNATQLLHETST